MANFANNERGSILVAALVLTSVLTLLGFALFDLATLDNRLAMGTEAEYRALELAESGLQAVMYQLFLDLCGGNPRCASPPPNPSWADGVINGTSFPVTTASFANFIPSSSTAVSGSFAGESYSGTVSVDLKNLTQSEAAGAAIGLVCRRADGQVITGATPNEPCAQLIYARATGNFRSGVGTASRTIQVVVRADFNGPGSGGRGLTAGSPASGTITGNADLHGSLHIMPCPSGSCAQLSFTGNTGIFNNYNGLSSIMQNYVPRLPAIVCASGTACDGLTVETLESSVRVAKPDNNTLHLGGSAEVGEPGSGNTNSVTGVVGKPTVEGVYLGNGCDQPDCSDQVDQPSHVHTDKPILGYDQFPAPTFPTLNNAATVFTRTYDNYAACSGPGGVGQPCDYTGNVVPPGTPGNKDFFITHAVKVIAPATPCVSPVTGCLTTDDDKYTCDSVTGCTSGHQNLLDLLSKQAGLKWEDSTANFSFTFKCVGAGAVACDDADGNRVNGHICTSGGDCTASKADGYQVEWNKATTTVSVYRCPSDQPAGSACGVARPTATASGSIPVAASPWRYRVSYVDAGGTEFALSPVVNVTITTGPQNVTFKAPAGPVLTTATRRLYRFRPGDTYRLVGTFGDNDPNTPVVDNVPSTGAGNLGTKPVLPASLNEGLLSDASLPTLPVLVYVDDRLKLCEDCNASHPSFSFRGQAIFLAKGNTADTPTSNTASIAIDTDFRPACSGACPANAAAPQPNLFRFYTPGNLFMSAGTGTAQRDHTGEYYAGSKWKTAKQTNVLGTVTAQVFDMGSQVPNFWQMDLPHTPTAFPPSGPASGWILSKTKWKECLGTIPSGAC